MLIWPISQLTHGDAVVELPSQHEHIHVADEELIPSWMEIRVSQRPLSLRLISEGHVLWSMPDEPSDDQEWQERVKLHLIEDGCDIIVEAEWPKRTISHAIELTLAPDGLSSAAQTLWGDEKINEVAEFNWR